MEKPIKKNSQGAQDVVADFLLEALPQRLRRVYEVLASLSYPITDRKALRTQIEKSTQDEGSATIRETLAAAFEARDLPLQTPFDALDKLHARTGAGIKSPLPGPAPLWGPMLPPYLPDVPDEPAIVIEDPDFGTDACGLAAMSLYRRRLEEARRYRLSGSEVLESAYNEAHDFELRCRANIPDHTPGNRWNICGIRAESAWAQAIADGKTYSEAGRIAQRVYGRCQDLARPVARPSVPLPPRWP